MAFRKSKLTKYVWWWDRKWKIEQVISPTPFDDLLLISRETDDIHEDCETSPVEMYLLDVHNDKFVCDTKEGRRLVTRLKELKEEEGKTKMGMERIWMDWFKDFD